MDQASRSLSEEQGLGLHSAWQRIMRNSGITIQAALESLRKQRLSVMQHLYDCIRFMALYVRRADNRQDMVDDLQRVMSPSILPCLLYTNK